MARKSDFPRHILFEKMRFPCIFRKKGVKYLKLCGQNFMNLRNKRFYENIYKDNEVGLQKNSSFTAGIQPDGDGKRILWGFWQE